MSRTGWIWAIIAVIVVAIGTYWLMSQPQDMTANTNEMSGELGGGAVASTSDSGTATGGISGSVDVGVGSAAKTVTVTYNGSGFSPSSVTINKGDTVKFTASSGSMWVVSDEHPSHTEFDGTSRTTHCAAGYTGVKPFDQCAAGSSYSFTFDKAGTYQYHNHVNAAAQGTVVVE